MLAIGLALVAAAPSHLPLAGEYGVNQMEMAGGLELRPDGGFRYALEYGAVSERAEGRWAISASGVRLTSTAHETAAPESARADFRGEPLALDGADLLLKRWDTVIRFIRVAPGDR